MKKVFSLSFVLLAALSLTSCKVNWFDKTIDVPWYYIAMPVAIIFIVTYLAIISRIYVCPQCRTEFKVKPHQLYVSIHYGNRRVAKCPNCGRKGFCDQKTDN